MDYKPAQFRNNMTMQSYQWAADRKCAARARGGTSFRIKTKQTGGFIKNAGAILKQNLISEDGGHRWTLHPIRRSQLEVGLLATAGLKTRYCSVLGLSSASHSKLISVLIPASVV